MGKVALIDADSLIYINVHCKKLLSNDNVEIIDDWGKPVREVKTLKQCEDGVDNMIKHILRFTGATSYLLFLTSGRNFRYNIYPEYKANRKYGDKPMWFDEVKTHLLRKEASVVHSDLEADDLCNIYKNVIKDSFICAIDKDMLKLEGKHFNYSKNQWVEVTKDEACRNFWASMITGDSVDGIKGIPGKGPKAVEEILHWNLSWWNYPGEVLFHYIEKFGQDLGIQEYYKNYMVLKIKDKWDGLEIVQPIEVEDEFKKTDN